MARRYGYPYNGRRYLLNRNTNELHDLDNEKLECEINKIRTDHIEMFDTLEAGLARQRALFGKQNGCYWCLRPYHTS